MIFRERALAEPDREFEALTDINTAFLKLNGIKAVALDLDNTCVYYGSFKPEEGTKEWIDSVKEAGIDVIILSNTVLSRGFVLSRILGGLPFVAPALKPFTFGMKLAAKYLGIKCDEMLVVGDKLSTDIAVANKTGAMSAKVKPLTERKREIRKTRVMPERLATGNE